MSQNVHLHGSDFFLKGTKWLHADLIPAQSLNSLFLTLMLLSILKSVNEQDKCVDQFPSKHNDSFHCHFVHQYVFLTQLSYSQLNWAVFNIFTLLLMPRMQASLLLPGNIMERFYVHKNRRKNISMLELKRLIRF